MPFLALSIHSHMQALSRGFPFGYIQPTSPNIEFVMRKMYPEDRGPLADVPNSGPAPVLMRWDELLRVGIGQAP